MTSKHAASAAHRHTPGRAVSGWLLVIVLLAGSTGGLAWMLRHQAANHFGFALPGADGLPFRIPYAGRDYANPWTCAGAGWCPGAKAIVCTTADALRSDGYWPLRQAATLYTWGGAPRPIFRAPTPTRMTTMALYVPIRTDCLLAYTLEGGP